MRGRRRSGGIAAGRGSRGPALPVRGTGGGGGGGGSGLPAGLRQRARPHRGPVRGVAAAARPGEIRKRHPDRSGSRRLASQWTESPRHSTGDASALGRSAPRPSPGRHQPRIASVVFTGIIESVGSVAAVTEGPSGRTLAIAAPFAGELVPGQSVAVDGACLTVLTLNDGTFSVQVGASTLARTVAARYGVGAAVNLERALKVGDRLDGHLVQGHVDGLATFLGARARGETRFLDFALPDDVFATTILHGSIALNGVSLTVNGLHGGGRCEVAIIPYTWEHTNFHALGPGDPVNVEGDLIGRYVRRVVENGRALPGREGRVHAS
ncbi:MAG: riboflavin synthase [Gemmatimonadetes bacterium]|nr:riboflavin synthase [Gemmatimonadota bacterium]